MATTKKRRNVWAWLPALLVLAATICTAAGISLVPTASAVNADLDVTATVAEAINVASVCGDATGPAYTDLAFAGTFSSGGGELISPDCAVVWDTNSANGGTLTIEDLDAGDPFFCIKGAGCGTDSSNFDNKGAGKGALGADEFGVALESVAGVGACSGVGDANPCDDSPASTFNVDLDCGTVCAVAVGDAEFYPVTEAATKACGTDSATAAVTCTFVFGGQPAAPQDNGAYTGEARFVAAVL